MAKLAAHRKVFYKKSPTEVPKPITATEICYLKENNYIDEK
jgi:hypothetical protein